MMLRNLRNEIPECKTNIDKNGKCKMKKSDDFNKTSISDKDNDKHDRSTDLSRDLSLEMIECNEKKNYEDDFKHKSKKSKRTKHGKKHKKKKVDLSEGELTPSDNDNSYNDTEIDKSFSSTEKNVNNQESPARGIIGPVIPPEFKKNIEIAEMESIIEISDSGQVSSDDESYGPLPTSAKLTKAHYELEKRALEMRIDKMKESGVTDEKIREEWMTELPDSKARHLGLGPRKFRAREGPDMSDRSMWTDTPLNSAKSKVETESETSRRIADGAHRLRIQEKDIQQEKIVKKLKKKHKRDESLLEMHEKKLRKKKKKEKEAGQSTERRRFDRNIDLGVNRFDEAQKKSILKKAQLLDTRFSRGESKFL